MIKSMTGFGRAQEIVSQRDITVEIRSVNHRYFEFSSRTSRAYGYLDEKLKSFVSESVSRGKIDVSVFIQSLDESDVEIGINKGMVKGYVDALKGLEYDFDLKDDLGLSAISRFSDIFNITRVTPDEEEVWQAVKQVLAPALEKFVKMRETEGQKLYDDLLMRMKNIEALVAEVAARAPETVENYRSRLYGKMEEVLADTSIDEARILTEAAIFADKVAVDEELTRLGSHIGQFREILSGGGAIGRKLDFLVQEFNRETNTIGSKCQNLEVSQLVVEMKAEIEKIREQIQNIE